MDQELEQKILSEIAKSGFPLELSVVDELQRRGFLVSPNLHYQDQQRDVHEIDALAFLAHESHGGDWPFGGIGMTLQIECKRSDKKPWVFFEEPADPRALLGLVPQLRCMSELICEHGSILAGGMNSPLAGHHLNAHIPRARSYFEAFKDHKNTGDIFKAIASVCYAMDFSERWFRNPVADGEIRRGGRSFICHGVIVYDGLLAMARRENGQILLAECPHVLVRVVDTFTRETKSPLPDNEVIIDVVSNTYFPKYLDLCRDDLTCFADHLQTLRKSNWLRDAGDF